MKTGWIALALGVAAGGASAIVHAGGFGIATQAGAGTGNAYTSGAASAEDAASLWFNPASMALLPRGTHVSGALHLLRPSFKFQNEGSTIPSVLGSGNGGDGGDWNFVPNGAIVTSLANGLSVGVSLNAPFGLKTEYGEGWIGQPIALMSGIKAVNVNPAIAYKASPALSIGFGLNVQYLEAELTNTAGALGVAKLEANDVGYGWNVGAMFQASPSTRIGIAYRSSIKYELDGGIAFSAAPTQNANATADLRTPDSVSLSVFSAVTPKWDVMADITWTQWSHIKSIVPTCRQANATVCASGVGSPIRGATLPTNWKDTWRIGVGANYKYSEQTKLRFGLAYDPTPTNDVDRTARLPDQDRLWVALGAQVALSRQGRLEIGYAHEFVRDARVDTQVSGTAFRQTGRFNDRADIVSVAYSHSF